MADYFKNDLEKSILYQQYIPNTYDLFPSIEPTQILTKVQNTIVNNEIIKEVIKHETKTKVYRRTGGGTFTGNP